MTKIVLTRHGHVEGIKPERFRGREPLALGRPLASNYFFIRRRHRPQRQARRPMSF
jgi:hypothetical protein